MEKYINLKSACCKHVNQQLEENNTNLSKLNNYITLERGVDILYIRNYKHQWLK